MIPTLLTDSVTPDLERAVHYALLWGLEAVELRSVGGPMDRIPHVNERSVRRRLNESELPVAAVVPGLFEGDVAARAAWLNDLATLEETLQFCSRIGCARIVMSSFRGDATDENMSAAADALRQAGRRAEKRNVTLCVLNEEGGLADTGARLEQLLEIVDSAVVQAAWDPTAALASGEDPAKPLRTLAPRVGLVRCRNVERSGNGWEPRAIDRGALNWGDQIRQLADAGFAGPVSLDVAAEPKSKAGLHDATTLIRLIRQALK